MTTPEILFGEINAYVEKAQAMIESGAWVDLQGLDKDVEALCLSVAALSREQAQAYAPELEYLRERITVLGKSLEACRDSVKNELRGADTIERANKAYVQSTSLAPDKKP